MNDSPALKSILLLAANPKGTVSLRLQEEEREIKERLRLAGYGKVPIHSTGATRTRDIQQAMLDFKPQIVHFTGHGAGKDGLAFEDATGQPKLVDSDALANLFKLFSSRVECVVLNACYSEFQAKAIAQHIDYVIGMSQSIGDRAAIEFAVGFYTALGAGESIEFAYELGCNAIQLEGIPEHLTPVILSKTNNKSINIKHLNIYHQNNLELEDEDRTLGASTIAPSVKTKSTSLWARKRFLILASLGGFGFTTAAFVSQISREALRSERGTNYSQLRDLLKEQRWADANRTTREILLKLCGLNIAEDWKVNGVFDENSKNRFKQDIDQIPCIDLLTIDQLWARYSDGKFSYSVQKKIYLDFGGKIDGEWHEHEPEWNKFATSIGWEQSKYNDERLIFDISAPSSHFPACWWFGGLFFSRIILRLEKCKNAT